MTDNKKQSLKDQIDQMKFVDLEKQDQCLQTAIYQISKNYPFLGSVLQCMNISFHYMLPTAGIHFDNDGKKWQMDINPFYYCECLDDELRQSILLHEMSHITHKHPIRVPFLRLSPDKRNIMNIAADMAINQYIKRLAKGCQQCPPKEQILQGVPCKNEKCPGYWIDVADYQDEDKKTGKKIPWPDNKPMEYYYDKLLRRFKDMQYNGGGGEGEGEGDGKNGKGQQTADQHNWGEGGNEQDMLDSTEELVKRAMIKQSMSYDQLPGHVKELLQDIEARRTELNYRALILQAIKRSASGHERKHTWTRKSRRFGNMAPGTRVGDLPLLDMYIDTSGSISVQEGNEFLGIVDNFLKAGSRKCWLNLFHTSNYYRQKYKLGSRLSKNEWESGGTCLEQSLRQIADTRPDLAIFLTDGYYSDIDVESWMPPGQKFPQCLFIISRDGSADHPLQRLGKTIKIPATNVLGGDEGLEDL